MGDPFDTGSLAPIKFKGTVGFSKAASTTLYISELEVMRMPADYDFIEINT